MKKRDKQIPEKKAAPNCDSCPKRWGCLIACPEVNEALNRADDEISAVERRA